MRILNFRILIAFVMLFLGYLNTGRHDSSSATNGVAINGTVVDGFEPVPGASVRIRATNNRVFSDENGGFILGDLNSGEQVEITAWADGYYVASLQVIPPASGVILSLRKYHNSDNPDYLWISPEPSSSDKACGNCHPMILPQWEANAHGRSIFNPRFFSMYNGTDLSGLNKIPPGYLDDFPGTAGNCANCHAPAAAVDGYLTTNMNSVRDAITDGIHCDYCHKVGGVYLHITSGTVYPNAPGVSSQRILRPPSGDNIFFGPYDDIPDPDTHLPEISESRFCAPCHQFSFWGTPIYESFNEWLESQYAAAGITCQNCHMPPNGDSLFALPEVGGLFHPPENIPSHLQVGAGNVDLLQNSVELSTEMVQNAGKIIVSVQITNTGAGHHVPTDHPGRHLILIVTILDEHDQPLRQISGTQVPEWGGEQAGAAGKAYAKVLMDTASGNYPVVSYWKPTSILSDNRIPAGQSDFTKYTFQAPAGGESVHLLIELRFRRLYHDTQSAKSWDTPDIVMEQTSQFMVVSPWWDIYLPLVNYH